jgi:hypothetical protein
VSDDDDPDGSILSPKNGDLMVRAVDGARFITGGRNGEDAVVAVEGARNSFFGGGGGMDEEGTVVGVATGTDGAVF